MKANDTVKNSILKTLIKGTYRECKVKVNNFGLTIDHEYFICANDLVHQLNYDGEDSTLMLPFDQLNNKKSRLHV